MKQIKVTGYYYGQPFINEMYPSYNDGCELIPFEETVQAESEEEIFEKYCDPIIHSVQFNIIS